MKSYVNVTKIQRENSGHNISEKNLKWKTEKKKRHKDRNKQAKVIKRDRVWGTNDNKIIRTSMWGNTVLVLLLLLLHFYILLCLLHNAPVISSLTEHAICRNGCVQCLCNISAQVFSLLSPSKWFAFFHTQLSDLPVCSTEIEILRWNQKTKNKKVKLITKAKPEQLEAAVWHLLQYFCSVENWGESKREGALSWVIDL